VFSFGISPPPSTPVVERGGRRSKGERRKTMSKPWGIEASIPERERRCGLCGKSKPIGQSSCRECLDIDSEINQMGMEYDKAQEEGYNDTTEQGDNPNNQGARTYPYA